MTLLQEELCEGSSAGEMEHLPETWGIELNIVSLGGKCHWAALYVLGCCPSGASTPSLLQKLLGLQDHRARKGEDKPNMNLSSPLVSAPNYKVKIHVLVPDSRIVAFPPF